VLALCPTKLRCCLPGGPPACLPHLLARQHGSVRVRSEPCRAAPRSGGQRWHEALLWQSHDEVTVDTDAEQAALSARLRALREQRARLERDIEFLDTEIRGVVRRAVEAGLSYRVVGALLGVSQTSIQNWLREPDG
jgi:DNA-directed RNA polymerase specialized sigma24 family protein